VTFLPVNTKYGAIEAVQVKEALRHNTCLVTVMMANNETGVLQPIKDIVRIIKDENKNRKIPILVHTDAAQSIGKIPVSIQDVQVDYLTIVGHKFYGPRIGAIYHHQGAPCQPPIFIGGGQEFGRRAGTENTPMVVGLGMAAQLVIDSADQTTKDLENKRNILLENLLIKSKFRVNFEASLRLPNTASLCFKTGVDNAGVKILEACNGQIEASRTAACHTSSAAASSVLIKSGLNPEDAASTIRLSVGRYTSEAEVKEAAKILNNAYENICDV
jgi:selenocysteine lyase